MTLRSQRRRGHPSGRETTPRTATRCWRRSIRQLPTFSWRDWSSRLSEAGLAVVDVAATDDQTAFAIQQLLAGRWATASADGTTRVPGEPGVRLRCYLDVRQQLRS
ncbi:DUF6207 family protein [Streptomyces swartbergensis]|uniref:DUF6207 family protein n=1 Tax=Streptomyces swartbergensis TaxID=487165 RepID=UPI00380EA6A6